MSGLRLEIVGEEYKDYKTKVPPVSQPFISLHMLHTHLDAVGNSLQRRITLWHRRPGSLDGMCETGWHCQASTHPHQR